MEYSWSLVLGTVFLATLLLWIVASSIFRREKSYNSLDSRKRGKTVLITGPPKSGKTLLFQRLANPDSSHQSLLQSVHSLKANVTQFHGRTTLIDLPFDSKKLHSQPADYFHFNDLAALILCFADEAAFLTELDLIVVMTFAIGALKQVPLCISMLQATASVVDKDALLSKLLRTLNTLQHSRLSDLLSQQKGGSISFEDPINRLIFESSDGEVADYQSILRTYFDEQLTFNNQENVSEWIVTL